MDMELFEIFRRNKKISANHVFEAIGITEKAYDRWVEKGVVNVGVHVFMTMCSVIGLTEEQMRQVARVE